MTSSCFLAAAASRALMPSPLWFCCILHFNIGFPTEAPPCVRFWADLHVTFEVD